MMHMIVLVMHNQQDFWRQKTREPGYRVALFACQRYV